MTTDFDTQVGNQLKLMNQLANIHELSVKSLLLTKLETIKQKNICCNLEVLRPLRHDPYAAVWIYAGVWELS